MPNPILRRECQYFSDISSHSSNQTARQEYVKELERIFSDADSSTNGEIDRREFERLIQGYFEIRGIRSTRDNFDKYFNRIDVNRDKSITFQEFVIFCDQVNEQEVMPIFEKELNARGLL